MGSAGLSLFGGMVALQGAIEHGGGQQLARAEGQGHGPRGQRRIAARTASTASPRSRGRRPPTQNVARGRRRHEAKIPRLKTICQRPGSIQRLSGTARTRTSVRSAPATRLGQNCSSASQVISRVIGEDAFRARTIISSPAARPLTTAAPIQSDRYAPTCVIGSAIVAAWIRPASSATTPENATGIAR